MGHDNHINIPIGHGHTTDNHKHANTRYTHSEFAETPIDSGSSEGGSADHYTFTNYQDDAGSTAIYPDAGEETSLAINYVILGLVGEAGEIANKYKKVLRDNYGVITPEVRANLKAELGDVLWYCAQLATELQADLGEVAADNYRKLSDRKSRNVIHGSGDER